MATTPTVPPPAPTSERVKSDPQSKSDRDLTHKARFRASLAWALDEYADTLAKLAK